MKRIVSLKGIVPLRPSVLALPLILLLALLRLSNGGAARKDCESCDDTLRLKCNFYYKTHLISGKDTGALSSLQLANLLGAARPMAAVSNFGRKIPKYSLNSKPAILTVVVQFDRGRLLVPASCLLSRLDEVGESPVDFHQVIAKNSPPRTIRLFGE
ncbi:MAG: hypothetical protein NTV97_12080 [Alphaproteobacteria bacterium]|nr:hypothetical protein [Alphaproteobacteria bacterium]